MTPMMQEIVAAIEAELDVREMVQAAPQVIRRLQAERIARRVVEAIERLPGEDHEAPYYSAGEWSRRNMERWADDMFGRH